MAICETESMYRSYFRRSGLPGRYIHQRAFTLVEVVLAIGVVAFGLIAILGLMSVSLRNSREANVREGLTMVLDRMNSVYQGQNFTNSLAVSQTSTNYYFDNSGVPTTNTASYFYLCNVTNATPATTSYFFQSATTVIPQGSAPTNYFGVLQVSVRWPYPQLNSTNISLISILNCQ